MKLFGEEELKENFEDRSQNVVGLIIMYKLVGFNVYFVSTYYLR